MISKITIKEEKYKEHKFPKLMIDTQSAIVVLFGQNFERGTVVWTDREKTFYNVGDYNIGWDEKDFVEFTDQKVILEN